MTSGSVHNVNDYAPPGYKLAATHYADGKCTHVFSADGQRDVQVVIGQHEDELKVLETFRRLHSLPSGNLTSEAAVRFADTLPAPAPKPAKRKGGNGG